MTEIPAQPDDSIARYLYSSQNFNSLGAKHNAFIDTRNPSELSVCVTTGLSEAEIWEIASIIRIDKPVKARADLLVSTVQAISNEQGKNLQVLIDGILHPRHANIKHLPLDKSKQRAVAADLANKSMLKMAA